MSRGRWRRHAARGWNTVLDVARPLAAEGISIVALSEMGRGGYIAGDRSPVATLAAAKESGAIEYFADLQIGLRNVAGEDDLIDVDTPKNRLGTKPDLRLRLDHARAQFRETDRPTAAPRGDRDAERDAAKITRAERAARELVPKVIGALAEAGARGCSVREVRAALPGRNAVLDAALRLAVADGATVARPFRGFPRYYLTSAAPPDNDAPPVTLP